MNTNRLNNEDEGDWVRLDPAEAETFGLKQQTDQYAPLAKEHIEASNVPEELKRTLLAAELNYLVNGGDVAPFGVLDHEDLVEVPAHLEKEALWEFLWAALVAHDAQCVEFAFVGDTDQLVVIYFSRQRGYFAKAECQGDVLGKWQVEELARG